VPIPRVAHDDALVGWLRPGIPDRPDHPPAPDARLGRIHVNVPYVPPPRAPAQPEPIPQARRPRSPSQSILPPAERQAEALRIHERGMGQVAVGKLLGGGRDAFIRIR
jgi:hypothetical protein